MKSIDVTPPEGYEVEEITHAQDIAYDIIQDAYDWLGVGVGEDYADSIAVADRIVEALIAAGWRPTDGR